MILVTGGTGLVGSHLLYELLKKGSSVRAIHRKNSDLKKVLNIFNYYSEENEGKSYFDKIEWVEANINDIPQLTHAFEGIETVYHCAALVTFDSGKSKELRKINIEGTANMVNLAISFNIKKFCHISSIATLDLPLEAAEITENVVWNPEINHSEYAITKHGAEMEVWRATQEGLPALILNPGVIIGPGFWNSGSGQIFQKINKGLNYYFPKITGFVGVKDVVNTAVLAMESAVKNQQFICVSENLSFKEVFNFVAKNLGRDKPKKELRPWMISIGWLYQSFGKFFFGAKKQLHHADVKSLFKTTYYSNEKLKTTFLYNFTAMEEVIKETSHYYKKDRIPD